MRKTVAQRKQMKGHLIEHAPPSVNHATRTVYTRARSCVTDEYAPKHSETANQRWIQMLMHCAMFRTRSDLSHVLWSCACAETIVFVFYFVGPQIDTTHRFRPPFWLSKVDVFLFFQRPIDSAAGRTYIDKAFTRFADHKCR